MSGHAYSARVRDCFFHPRHAGCLSAAVSAQGEDQGMRLCLCAKTSGERIETLRFRAWGCPHFIAAAEAFCRQFEGMSAASLLDFSAKDLISILPVPVEKTGRILVLEDVVRTLGSLLRTAEADD